MNGRSMNIGVVDYEAGNLTSVETALSHLGASYAVVKSPEQIEQADRLIFPGVGEAFAAMSVLKKTGMDEGLRNFAASGKLFLGICIGCQLLLERSEERSAQCLGMVPGKVKKFPPAAGYKIPHMGWNEVVPAVRTPLFQGIAPGTDFYFVHSYYPAPENREQVLCETDYIITFPSGIIQDNLFALQFHPEKSGPAGLRILDNFVHLKE